MQPTETEIILVPATPNDSPITHYQTLLVNGGVTILAIIALTYFSKTLIDSITNLLDISTTKK